MPSLTLGAIIFAALGASRQQSADMIIRHKYHWVELIVVLLCLAFALACLFPHHDPVYFRVLMPLFLSTAIVLFAAWSESYTSLTDGVLTERIFSFIRNSFPVEEIERVLPHGLDGSRSYGTVVIVTSKSGRKMTVQLNNRPERFFDMLREQSPQAEFYL